MKLTHKLIVIAMLIGIIACTSIVATYAITTAEAQAKAEAQMAETEAQIAHLEGLAEAEGVPVHYVPKARLAELQKVFGFDYEICGLYVHVTGIGPYIMINEAYRTNYTILAHELGHHYAITLYNDKSEETAWEIGYCLIEHGSIDGFEYEGTDNG